MPAPGVYVTNLREVRAVLRKVHPDLVPVFRDELKRAASTVVVPRAKAKVPHRSGDAAGSIRVISGGNRIYVRAGKAKVPYYGWLDFGGYLMPTGRRRNTQYRPIFKRGRYLYPAVDQSAYELAQAAGKAVDRTITKLGLN